jgi:serine/threonine/tyrosine-interacting protein
LALLPESAATLTLLLDLQPCDAVLSPSHHRCAFSSTIQQLLYRYHCISTAAPTARVPLHPSATATMATFSDASPVPGSLDIPKPNHQEYSYRLPTPPRIIIPPPTLSSVMPELALGPVPAEDVDMSFLRDLALDDIVQKNTLLEWVYEHRRQAQIILPWLYLGPMLAARDKAFLTREGITMVLGIRARQQSMNGALRIASEVCEEVNTVEAPTYQSLIGQFANVTRGINAHVARVRQMAIQQTGQPSLGKVLIFCESGNDMSAAVTVAYLMETLSDFDYIKAMQVCQAQRFCANFDDTSKHTLRAYWDIIQARRAVATFNTQTNGTNLVANKGATSLQPSFASKAKRTIDETHDDDDVDMGGDVDFSDALRFQGRDTTPFQDHHRMHNARDV